jgi:hypothetical protein
MQSPFSADSIMNTVGSDFRQRQGQQEVTQCLTQRPALTLATLRSEEFSEQSQYLKGQAHSYQALRRAGLPIEQADEAGELRLMQ